MTQSLPTKNENHVFIKDEETSLNLNLWEPEQSAASHESKERKVEERKKEAHRYRKILRDDDSDSDDSRVEAIKQCIKKEFPKSKLDITIVRIGNEYPLYNFTFRSG